MCYPTFKEVDGYIQAADLDVFEPEGEFHFTRAEALAAPAAVAPKVCAAYKVVRPFLTLLAGVPLIPDSWKKAVATFMGSMDILCTASLATLRGDAPVDYLTFEAVDAYIRATTFAAFEEGQTAIVGNVCSAYKVVRPILALVAGAPLIPSSWKKAVQVFMTVLDTFCP